MGKIAIVLALALALSGCPKGAYHSAVVAEHDFTTGLKSFQQAEMIESQNGRIDAAEHQKLEAGIEKAAMAAQILVTSLQSGAANSTVQQNFATVGAALNDLLDNGVLGVKNDQSKLLLKTLIQTVQAILSNVGSLLTQPAATGVKP